MGFVRTLWNWIASSPRKDHKKWHPDLNPVDIQKISVELNLKAEAQRLGSAGVPKETDQKLAGPEAAIVHKIDEARQNYMTWGELRLASLNQELARKDITQQINQARKADEEFERMASAELTARFATLRDLREVAYARKDELERFKRKNKLERLPVVPVGNAKLLIVVIALVLVGVEAMLNMSFFAKGLSTGLLGGFVEAASAAAVNVGVAFACGAYFVRFVHHAKPWPKLFGVMAVVLASCFIFTMAFGIAHYRDALVAGADNGMSIALQTLLSSPAGLHEPSSWLLFVVSVLFGTIAVFDGYKIDDPYPGYGKKFRLADEALQDYNAEIDELHAYLDEAKKDMLIDIERAVSHSETSVAVYRSLIGEKERSGNDLARAVGGADAALQALLQEFRDENKIARGDTPTPAYFNTWPELRVLKMPNFDTTADEANLADQHRLLQTFLGEVQDVRARIQTAFNQRFSALQTLDTNFIEYSAATEASASGDFEAAAAPDSTVARSNLSIQGAK